MKEFKTERSAFGRFYYRFPQGEAGLDVYDRVSLFIGTLFREWEKHHESTAASNVLVRIHLFIHSFFRSFVLFILPPILSYLT